MLSEERKKILKKTIPITLIIIALLIVVFIMYKYNVEGEKNMPFKLTKISIISTANGVPNEETRDRWNLNLIQNNDMYFTFEKNENFKNITYIKRIAIENINIVRAPRKRNGILI